MAVEVDEACRAAKVLIRLGARLESAPCERSSARWGRPGEREASPAEAKNDRTYPSVGRVLVPV